MHFDDLLKQLGEFGPYQKRVYFLLVIPTVFVAIQVMTPIFIMGEQSFTCDLPDNTTREDSNPSNPNEGEIIHTYPNDSDTSVEVGQCEIKKLNNENKSETVACSVWKYDTSVFTSTAISEFNMVCNNRYAQSHMKMAFFAGCLTSTFFDGIVADLFGRKPIFLLCFIVMFISSLALAWAPSITVFGILRYLIGFTNFGIFNMGILIGLELVGPSKRIWSGIIIELVFCVGEVLLCLAAYFIRDWKTLTIVVSAPSAVSLFYFFLIPESPRWLLSQGRNDDAMKIIQQISKSNNKKMLNVQFEKETNEKYGFRQTILPALKSKMLVMRLIILTTGWAVISMTYYGITYNVGRIGGNIYLNFLLSILVEFLGYSSCLVLSEKLGRRCVHCGCLIITGMACIGTIFTTLYASETHNWITIALSMIGKFFISAAFGNVFLYTTELFPTGIRAFVLTTSNIGSRSGAMLSPYIADLGTLVKTDFGRALPLVIFGTIAGVVGFLSLLNPETVNMKLPKNIDEAKKFQRYFKSEATQGDEDFSEIPIIQENQTTPVNTNTTSIT